MITIPTMTNRPTDVVTYFTEDHRACDAIWAEVEAAVDAGDDAGAKAAFDRFAQRTRRHLNMEEEVLFPAFERATGMHGGGPTMVMRMEHERMRAVLDGMAAAAASGSWEDVSDHGDTLLMLTQQHNMKEEGMLYPMADARLGPIWDEVADALARFS